MKQNTSPSPMPPCDHSPAPYEGPTREEVLHLRREHISPGVFLFYREPIMLVEGHMQYLWDETGKRYLDALGGIVTVSVGHSHPKLVEAIRQQAGKLVHTTTIYLHPTIGQFAKKLAEHLPKGSELSSTYFTCSGSEANDLAITIARLHTGNYDVISLRNGYHGGSAATMGMTAMGNWKFPLPLAGGMKHALPGYCYRCPLGLEYPSCDVKCARDIASLIDYETSGKVAAFIAEPIQGAGGVVDPPPEYFGIIYDIVRAHGGLCIADEVQTGFGRTGENFWGFENYGVVPDIVTMAKGIGNGAALGAVTTRKEVSAPLSQKLHFNTFGGNPLTMIQGLTTLEIIDEENLQNRAKEIGGYLKERLLDLKNRHALVGDVRGKGLLLGVELVGDQTEKTPATAQSLSILERCKDRGVLIGRGGVYSNVLRIKPPMCISREDVDFLAGVLDEALLAESAGAGNG